MPRARGGKRQGTPGKAYSNRTDLASDMNMGAGSPAAGGLVAPSQEAGPPPMSVYPEDTPSLMDPTTRPQEPITAGLPMGAGPGMEAMTNFDPRVTETQALKKWLPILDPLGDDPETPDSVRTLIRYIRSA